MGPLLFDYGYGPFLWVCLSGKREDLQWLHGQERQRDGRSARDRRRGAHRRERLHPGCRAYG
jgi:hypothetical protein